MRKSLVLVCLCLLASVLVYVCLLASTTKIYSQEIPRWFIEKADGRQGFIDSTGKEIFTGDYYILDRNYHDGLVFVFFQDKKTRGFLDVNGKVVFTSKYIWGSFSEGLIAIKDQTGFSYLNTMGKKEIDLHSLPMPDGKEISSIFSFKDGLAMIRIKNIGFDDSRKSDVPSCISFPENFNLYPGNWLYGFINKKGQWAIAPTLESATTFDNELSVVKKNGDSFFMNTKGEFISKFSEYAKSYPASSCSEGYAMFETSKGSYFIGHQGKRLGNRLFQYALPFSEGMAAIQIKDRWGFIDTTGKIVIEPKFYGPSKFKEGMAPVSMEVTISGKGSYFMHAFIDKKGVEVIPFVENTHYDNFQNGLAQGRRSIYSEGNRYTGYYELFYINKKGEKIWSEIVKQ